MKCDGCGAEIVFRGTMCETDDGKGMESFCSRCSSPANQEFRICTVCHEPMIDGMTDLEGFYAHEECFEKAMDERFSEWRQVDDDGCGGYYEWYDQRECERCGTGIFYTEWY